MMDEPGLAKHQTLPSTLRNDSTVRNDAPESTLKSEPPAVAQTLRSEHPPPVPASVPPPRTVWSEPPPAMWGPPSSHPPPVMQHPITVAPPKRHAPVALVLVIAVLLGTVLAGLAYAWSAGLF